MENLRIGILGATGVVGTEMRKILEERNVRCTELRLFADHNDAGQKVSFRGQELVVEEATDDSFDGVDILLVAVSNEVSTRFSPVAAKKGAVVIDNAVNRPLMWTDLAVGMTDKVENFELMSNTYHKLYEVKAYQ